MTDIDPNSAWAKKEFPDAVDSLDVGWMIVEWRIQHQPNRCSTCGGNYTLRPQQLNDLPLGATEGQAIAMLQKHINNRRSTVRTNDERAPVRDTLFLVKVVKVSNITDDQRTLLPNVVVDRDD